VKEKFRNLLLMIASLLFFAFGGTDEMIVFISTLLINYFLGLKIGNADNADTAKKWLIYGIIINVLVLFVFKYFNFFAANINLVWQNLLPENKIALPLGISFYTFHNISYLIDVQKRKIGAEKNFINLTLYISFFPQLIAGPIVRYVDVAGQVYHRKISLNLFLNGTKRFIIGLGKKVILANTFAGVADRIFEYDSIHYNTSVAWTAIIMYMLQIYYDFSGYSDMAIGLGRMMGFTFKENFNFPYSSTSVQEFWRKWHISLSSWFRDYVYIPLGGNRVYTQRLYFNILFVFLLTGIWHGANWNFFIWGILHGMFIILERTLFKKFIESRFYVLKNIYLIVVVMFTWVFFRLDEFRDAIDLFSALFSFNFCETCVSIDGFIDKWVMLTFIIGCIFIYPQRYLVKYLLRFNQQLPVKTSLQSIYLLSYVVLFIISIMSLASGTYNPFIYFRF
jgi:alginate O-acetyltransferase complex protein AlgI